MLVQHSLNSDWLFSTQSRVLQADWFLLETNEKAILYVNMPSYQGVYKLPALTKLPWDMSTMGVICL
mgnify:CR=1 FL=1